MSGMALATGFVKRYVYKKTVASAVPLTLGMGFSVRAPVFLIKLFRLAAGDGQRIPVVAGLDAGDLHDLADVITGMSE